MDAYFCKVSCTAKPLSFVDFFGLVLKWSKTRFFSELFHAMRDFGRQENSAFYQIVWWKNDPVSNFRCIVLVLQHSLVGITAGTSPDSVRMFKASKLCQWGHHCSRSASYPIHCRFTTFMLRCQKTILKEKWKKITSHISAIRIKFQNAKVSVSECVANLKFDLS
jgi:hypothetical protein